jgi:hypothetical protein
VPPDLATARPAKDYTPEKAQAFEAELQRKSDTELTALANPIWEARKQRTKKRHRFDDPKYHADIKHYAYLSFIYSIDEGVPLAFGKNPKIINWDKMRCYTGDSAISRSSFADDYAKLRELVVRAVDVGELPIKSTPREFAEWIEGKGYKMPPEFLEQIQANDKPREEDSLAVNQNESGQEPESAKSPTFSGPTLNAMLRLVDEFGNSEIYRKYGAKTQQGLIVRWLEGKSDTEHQIRTTKELISERYGITTARKK